MTMNNSHDLSSDVSRLISEEQIIDSVFQTCDVSHTGWVQVSRLVDCVKVAAGSPHNNDSLKLLVELLDPSSTNPKISMSTYRSGISQWIKMLRLNKYLDEECELSDVVGNAKDVSPKLVLPADLFPLIPSGFELSGRNDEFDTVELKNRLEYTEQQNRRLGEEVSDLRKQLNTSDDMVAQLTQENGQLKHLLKSNQATIDRLSAVRRENDELKQMLDSCMEEKKHLQTNSAKLEQANKDLSGNIANLQEQLSSARSEIESAEDALLNLHQLLNEKTLKLLSVEKTVEGYQLQLADKNNTIEEVEKKVDALSDMNKDLLKHNSEIEAQLTENKQLLHFQTVELTKRQLCDCFDEEIEDDVELMPFAPRRILPLPRQSTPQLRNIASLQQELTSKIVREAILPSPLCDKELEDIFYGSDEVLSTIVKDTDVSCFAKRYDDTSENESQSPINTTPTSTVSKRYTEIQSNEHLDVTCLKDSLTREVEGIAEMAIACNTQCYKHTLAAFVERMMACTDARITAEQRNVTFSTALREMQERMEEDEIQYRLAVQELENQLTNTAEKYESRLKEKEHLIRMEMQKNRNLEFMIMSWDGCHLNEAKTSGGGEEQIRVSPLTDDQQMALVCLPGSEPNFQRMTVNNSTERRFTTRLRDSAKESDAVMKLLVELFREYERHKEGLLAGPGQTVSASDEDDDEEGIQAKGLLSISRRQRNDADVYPVTTAMCNDAPVASCCHVIISLLLSVVIILVFGLVHAKDRLSCGRTLWSAFEEIFRPHITLRHTKEPPV